MNIDAFHTIRFMLPRGRTLICSEALRLRGVQRAIHLRHYRYTRWERGGTAIRYDVYDVSYAWLRLRATASPCWCLWAGHDMVVFFALYMMRGGEMPIGTLLFYEFAFILSYILPEQSLMSCCRYGRLLWFCRHHLVFDCRHEPCFLRRSRLISIISPIIAAYAADYFHFHFAAAADCWCRLMPLMLPIRSIFRCRDYSYAAPMLMLFAEADFIISLIYADIFRHLFSPRCWCMLIFFAIFAALLPLFSMPCWCCYIDDACYAMPWFVDYWCCLFLFFSYCRLLILLFRWYFALDALIIFFMLPMDLFDVAPIIYATPLLMLMLLLFRCVCLDAERHYAYARWFWFQAHIMPLRC